MTIEWRTFGEGWRRVAVVAPGFDDRSKGPSYGIGAEKWGYVVSDGECALALDVSSGMYPASVTHVNPRPSDGHDLSLHVPWPAGSDAEDEIRLGRMGHECRLIEMGRCWLAYSSALGATAFWKLHGVDSFEQPESFWIAMRDKAATLIADARAKHEQMKHLARCPHCAGRGVIEVP